jgi:(p)ppGpp synthase/HD superfamily hydrolase
MKHDLDEECFKILKPESYRRLKEELDEFEAADSYFKENAKKEVHALLESK